MTRGSISFARSWIAGSSPALTLKWINSTGNRLRPAEAHKSEASQRLWSVPRQHGRDITVADPRVPSLVGKVQRLAAKEWRVRHDHIKLRARPNAREEVRADGCDERAETVEMRVVRRSPSGSRIDVNSHDARCTGARSRQRKYPGPGANIRHPSASEVELRHKAGEIFAGEKVARMKHRRRNCEAQTQDLSGRGAAAGQDEFMRQVVNDPVRQPRLASPCSRFVGPAHDRGSIGCHGGVCARSRHMTSSLQPPACPPTSRARDPDDRSDHAI